MWLVYVGGGAVVKLTLNMQICNGKYVTELINFGCQSLYKRVYYWFNISSWIWNIISK